ncbi:hypothetical protein BG004_003134 [Podila humilis]|nr:hypothetical protein BG004_003134 [Podila humilis]
MPTMNLDDFTIHATLLEEIDEYTTILESMALHLRDQGHLHWPPGMFRSPEGQADLFAAIEQGRCYTVKYALSTTPPSAVARSTIACTAPNSTTSTGGTIAGLFMLNYNDPFDKILWESLFLEEEGRAPWTDALYLHRLLVQPAFQGCGLTSVIMAYAQQKVVESGRHYLRMDCMYSHEKLRKFYRERSLGPGRGGFPELEPAYQPLIDAKLARFELKVSSSP